MIPTISTSPNFLTAVKDWVYNGDGLHSLWDRAGTDVPLVTYEGHSSKSYCTLNMCVAKYVKVLCRPTLDFH
jgi:hypothetical protein